MSNVWPPVWMTDRSDVGNALMDKTSISLLKLGVSIEPRPAMMLFGLTILLFVGPSYAWFKVACTSPLVQERLDPIISPGSTPSNHVHTIHGASNFASNSTYDTLRGSNCTSCVVAEDLSNYWFPKLYFHDPKNGTFTPVPDGGLLVYYQNRGTGDVSNGGTGLKAFPPGFKMISGSPVRRSKKFPVGEGSQAELAERAVEWECLRYTVTTGYNSANTSKGFPTTDCEAGLNARIHMPACWDGVNLDSPDHVSHTAFLSDLDNGDCPSTHPVPLMKLLYEVTWDVHSMAALWDPSRDSWPFVWGGDPTGYSWHADFQNGWDQTALQNSIDKCNNPNDQTGQGVVEACSFLTVRTLSTADQCKTAPTVDEVISGQLDKLPGCNPIQAGPENATLRSDTSCLIAPTSPATTPSSAAHSMFHKIERVPLVQAMASAILTVALYHL